jgi:hypothetical protein
VIYNTGISLYIAHVASPYVGRLVRHWAQWGLSITGHTSLVQGLTHTYTLCVYMCVCERVRAYMCKRACFDKRALHWQMLVMHIRNINSDFTPSLLALPNKLDWYSYLQRM